MCGNESQAEAGVWVVLIFWPNFRLAVLIAVVLIKKACMKFNQVVNICWDKDYVPWYR